MRWLLFFLPLALFASQWEAASAVERKSPAGLTVSARSPSARPRVFAIGEGGVAEEISQTPSSVAPVAPMKTPYELLASGYAAATLAKTDDPLADGLPRPPEPTGLALVSAPGQLFLLCNHAPREKSVWQGTGKVSADLLFRRDADAKGCATRLTLDARSGERLSQELCLAGTRRNFAAAATPWGSFLSGEQEDPAPPPSPESATLTLGEGVSGRENPRYAEEGSGAMSAPGDVSRRAAELPGGLPPAGDSAFFEIPAAAHGLSAPLPLAGRADWSAFCIDASAQVLYAASSEGCLYRLTPALWGDLAKGGRWEVLCSQRPEAAATLSPTQKTPIYWTSLEGEALSAAAAKARAVKLDGVSGMACANGRLVLTLPKTGAENLGQLVVLERNSLSLLEELREEKGPSPRAPKCLTFTNDGSLLIGEGRKEGSRLLLRDPQGGYRELLRVRRGPVSGVAASPDGRFFFANLQEEGLTVAVKVNNP